MAVKKVSLLISEFLAVCLFVCSTSKAKNRRSQQVRGQIPENEGVVEVQNQTVGGGVKENPG